VVDARRDSQDRDFDLVLTLAVETSECQFLTPIVVEQYDVDNGPAQIIDRGRNIGYRQTTVAVQVAFEELA
jgi:hypothetical protein